MTKISIAEAAERFGVSKEAIHNRIRRGSLDCVIENGVKMVEMNEPVRAPEQTDRRYYEYIEAENSRLRAKIEKLEDETFQLRSQKEAMLLAERERIEQIYKERDAQLRSVLQVVASKFLTNHNMHQIIDDALEGSQDAEVIEERAKVVPDDLISLKKYLKRQEYGKKSREKLMERFGTLARADERIFDIEGKLYIRPESFDYSDLLE